MTSEGSFATTDEQPQRPTDDNRDAWRAYWQAQEMPWRTEPEIDEERRRFLAERRAITPDFQRGVYPIRDEHGSIKLDRADVEWLLRRTRVAGRPDQYRAAPPASEDVKDWTCVGPTSTRSI